MNKNRKCINCNKLLVGRQKKYCSKKCENFWRRTKNKLRKKYNKEYRKKYYKEHRDEVIKKSSEYCKNNKEKIKMYLKVYNEENKEVLKEKKKRYYTNNKEIINKGRKKFREDNKENIKKQRKIYKEKNKEKIKEANRKYCENNREKIKRKRKIYVKKNRETLLKSKREKERELRKNPIYRAGKSISKGVYDSLHSSNISKNRRHWEDIVGYTVSDLKKHLEKQFKTGMSWSNYGKWHIDHIIPQSFFKFKSIDSTEFKMCWRLENLQPLWEEENLRKGKRLIYRIG